MNSPKPQSKPAGKKLPRARVMYITDHEYFEDRHAILWTKSQINYKPVSVTPHATLKQARAAAKWANLTEEGKVERVAKALAPVDGPGWDYFSPDSRNDFLKQARAVLRAQGSL